MLQQTQLDELLSTNFINKVDDNLTIISELRLPDEHPQTGSYELIYLYLHIYFCGEKVTVMRFNLINYEYNDLLQIASELKSNAFILKEVDDFLCGDVE